MPSLGRCTPTVFLVLLGWLGSAVGLADGSTPRTTAEITMTLDDGEDVVVLRPELREVVGLSDEKLWSLDRPLEARTDGKILGRIESIEVVMASAFEAQLAFNVTAGGSAVAVGVASAIVPVTPTANPWAFATTSLEVIDNDGDGATLTGNLTGSAIYEARYNVLGPSTDWALLATSPLTAPAGSSDSGSFRRPAEGREVIVDNVTEIQGAFGFTLTALDSANGTATFSVALPPSTISATAGTPQATTVDTAFASELQVTLLDAADDPVPDVIVTFTAPGAGASATFPSGNTATTDAAGQASVPVVANSIAGSYLVTANISPEALVTPAEFALTNAVISVLEIPTLGSWGLLALILVLAGSGLAVVRRIY